jgi:hypothetical protein
MLLYLLKQRILSYSNIHVHILSKGYHIFVFGIRFILRLPGQIYLFPFLKERVIERKIERLKMLKVCLFVCPSQSDFFRL